VAMATKRQQHVLGLDLSPPQHPRLVLGQTQNVDDMPREEAHHSMIANRVAGAATYSLVASGSGSGRVSRVKAGVRADHVMVFKLASLDQLVANELYGVASTKAV